MSLAIAWDALKFMAPGLSKLTHLGLDRSVGKKSLGKFTVGQIFVKLLHWERNIHWDKLLLGKIKLGSIIPDVPSFTD
jgi:hypothetical protein